MLILEWKDYEDKSWYTYLYEEDYIKKYIENHEDTDWMYISNDKRLYFNTSNKPQQFYYITKKNCKKDCFLQDIGAIINTT